MSAEATRNRRAEDQDPAGARYTSHLGIALLGAYMLVLGLLLGSFLIALWPVVQRASEASGSGTTSESIEVGWLGFVSFAVTPDTSLLLVVLIFGAIGAYIHAVTSFVDYVGNRKLGSSWTWWYLLRPFVGTALALVFYVVLRGGFIAQDASTGNINPYGIAALAGLSGLFSKQATDKLREVFDTLFRTAHGGDDQRSDSLINPVPVITSLLPTTVVAGEKDLHLTVRGDRFLRESAVLVNDSTERTTTTYVSNTELTSIIEADLVATAGQLLIKVRNPSPGGGTSDSVALDVTPMEPSV